MMLSSNAFVIRLASDADALTLRRLAMKAHQAPLTGLVLVGEINGEIAAAISLADNRRIADPVLATDRLLVHMHARASGERAFRRQPNVSKRMLDALNRDRRVAVAAGAGRLAPARSAAPTPSALSSCARIPGRTGHAPVVRARGRRRQLAQAASSASNSPSGSRPIAS